MSASLTACSTAQTTKSSAGTAASSRAAAVTYSGPEAALPHTYPTPVPLNGKSCTIGYLQFEQAVTVLYQEQMGAAMTAQRLGCHFIALDANGSINTQVSQFNQLLAQKVNAIVVYPIDPGALGPDLAEAKKAAIPVIADNTPADASQPLPHTYTTDVLQGLDRDVFSRVQAVAEAAPGSSFAILGFSSTSPAIVYYQQREEYWGKKFGLKYLGTVSAAGLTATQTATSMSALIARYPDVHSVLTINDQVALTASAVALQSGKRGLLILGDNGTPEGVSDVRAGRLFDTYSINPYQKGKQLVWGAYDAFVSPAVHLPPMLVATGSVLVTKQNAASFKQPTP